MKRLKIGVGGALMLSAMLISDKFLVFAIYLFAALLHEAGHLLMAKARGIKIKEIKLDFSGARICVDERLTSYICEFWLAFAGPAVNFLASLITITACRFARISTAALFESAEVFMSSGKWDIVGASGFFVLASLAQAIINLLPVKTFDGGRLLYCFISELWDEKKAEHILSVTSAISAFVLWTVALYLMLRISSGLGIYVFSAGIFASTVIDKARE